MNRRTRLVTAVSALLGLVLAAVARGPVPDPFVLAFVLAVGIVSGLPAVTRRLPGRDVGLSVAATVVGASVHASWTVAVAVGLGAVLPLVARRQTSVRQLAVPARTVLDAGTTVAVAALLPGGTVVATAAAAAAGSLVGQLARAVSAAGSVAARSRLRPVGSAAPSRAGGPPVALPPPGRARPGRSPGRLVPWGIVRRALRAGAPVATVSAVGAASLVVVAARAPEMLLVLLVPVAVAVAQTALGRRRTAVAGMLGALLERQRELHGASHDRSADEVLTALARLLGGADVSMVLVTDAGPVELVGDEHGVNVRRQADGFGRWPRTAVQRRVVAGRQVVVVAVGSSSAPVARLEATRPVGAPAVRSSERAAVLALSRQAAVWLATVPAEEPGDAAWDGLREQVGVLRRAASGADLGEVLAALHEVRTAAAVLAGAAPGPASATVAWTSTGTHA